MDEQTYKNTVVVGSTFLSLSVLFYVISFTIYFGLYLIFSIILVKKTKLKLYWYQNLLFSAIFSNNVSILGNIVSVNSILLLVGVTQAFQTESSALLLSFVLFIVECVYTSWILFCASDLFKNKFYAKKSPVIIACIMLISVVILSNICNICLLVISFILSITSDNFETALSKQIILLVFCILQLVTVIIIHMLYFVIFLNLAKYQQWLAKRNIDDIKMDLLAENDAKEPAAKIELQENDPIFDILFKDVSDLIMVGQGATSIVFKCKWKAETVAMKLIKVSDAERYDLHQEIHLLKSLHHQNIVNYYGCCYEGNKIGIVSEYCENGSLHGYIIKNKEPSLKSKIQILIGICKGMRFLHSKRIIHRDLKTENILLTEAIIPKVSDFGFSKEENQLNFTKVGTAYYMAPEVASGLEYDNSCDVYSFAIIMYEVLFWTVEPYKRNQISSLYGIEMKVAQNSAFRPVLPEELIAEMFQQNKNIIQLVKIMTDCWDHSKDTRPQFREIVEVLEDSLFI